MSGMMARMSSNVQQTSVATAAFSATLIYDLDAANFSAMPTYKARFGY